MLYSCRGQKSLYMFIAALLEWNERNEWYERSEWNRIFSHEPVIARVSIDPKNRDFKIRPLSSSGHGLWPCLHWPPIYKIL